MDHWFDNLTRGLAQDKVSRRALLGSLLKTGLAAAGASLLGRSGNAAELLLGNSPAQQEQNSCEVRRQGRTLVTNLSASSTFKGRPLTYNQITRRSPGGVITVHKSYRLGGRTLIELETVKRGVSTRTNVSYGPGFTGIRRATFTSTDGKTLRGTIDNRRLMPINVDGDPRSAKFADGKPPPDVKISSDVPEAMRSILEKAKENVANCSAARRSHHAHANHSSSPPQGESGHDSSPETSAECIACEGACITAGIGCAIAVAAGCAGALFFYAVCLAVGEAGCLITEIGCLAACHITGAPCCPVSCGDVACCNKSETCLNSNVGVCCSQGLVGCAGKHCCQPTDTCINATGFCCPAGRIVCNNVCCKQGEVCKDGVACCPPTQVVCAGVCCAAGQVCVGNKKCCPSNLACGNVCCDELSKCGNASQSLCCGFSSQYCNGVCCKPGWACINNKCCSKPCGDACCTSTQACLNGKCVSKKCPQGQVTCVSQEKLGQTGAAICCPPNVACCLGKCCKPGEMCCSRGSAVPFGCHDPNVCIA